MEKEAEEDVEVLMEENPPLPEEQIEVELFPKRVKAVMEEEEVLPGK